jgi:choice-of-anchor A domain-containing protein
MGVPSRRSVALCAALLACGGEGCREPTQVNVVLRTNVPYEPGVQAALWATHSAAAAGPLVETAEGWAGVDIGNVVVTPQSGRRDGPLTVFVALGLRGKRAADCTETGDPKNCIRARRKLTFIPHAPLKLPVVLYRDCEGITCDPDSTCSHLGTCVPAQVDPNTCTTDEGCLLPGEPPLTLPATADAGADGNADAGVDASVPAGTSFFDSVVAGIDLRPVSGAAPSCWTAFALGGGVTLTSSAAGSFSVRGNIGVATSGTLTMQNVNVSGDAYLRNGAVPSLVGSTLSAGSPLLDQDPLLNPAAAGASAAALVAASLSADTGGGTLVAAGEVPSELAATGVGGLVLTGAGSLKGLPGRTYVLTLENLVLSGAGAELILEGAADTNYVLNVQNFFTLSSGARIRLAGGLRSQNVLVNLGAAVTYDVAWGGGSSIEGVILAPNRSVKGTGGSTITGQIIARGISLTGASALSNPTCNK